MNTCACSDSATGTGLKAHNRLWLGLLLGLLFVLGGCASTDESIPDWAGVKGDVSLPSWSNSIETAKFEVRWHSNVGYSGANPQQPALTRDAVYSAAGNGSLTRLDRATGKQVWSSRPVSL